MYPETPLAYRLEIAPGADLTADPGTYAWQDHTSALHLNDAIELKRGCDDEQGQGNTSLAFTLKNNDGRYTTDNPESDLYPYFDLNCPIRFSVDLGDGSGWHVRALQYLSETDDDWPSGTPHLAVARVTADGLFRRLGQGVALKSPLACAVLADGPSAYWPLDDASDATLVRSGLSGGTPMTWTTGLTFAAVDGPVGAPGKYPELIASGAYVGRIGAPVTVADNGAWCVEAWVKITRTDDTTTGNPVRWFSTGTHGVSARIEVTGILGCGVMAKFDNADSTISTLGAYGLGEGWHHVKVTATQDDVDTVTVALRVDNSASDDETYDGFTIGVPTYVEIPSSDSLVNSLVACSNLSIMHLAVYDTAISGNHYAAGLGHVGEMAHDRIERLALEQSIPSSITASTSVVMGLQSSNRLLDLLRECEATDHGILDDSQGVVRYRALNELCNLDASFVIDGARRQLALPFQPRRDDQKRRNSVTAKRPNDSNGATWTDDADVSAVGLYESDVSANVETDAQLLGHAQFAVGLGTVPGKRYPSIGIDLLRSPELARDWLAVELGDRITVINPPRQHRKGDVDQQVRGWAETYGPGRRRWAASLNAVPYFPVYNTIVRGADNDRREASSSTLAAEYGATDTSLSVETASGALWTTDAAHFPVYVDLAGEQVRVDSIAGASSPQTFTVVRSVNGVRKRQAAGTTVSLWHPGVRALA